MTGPGQLTHLSCTSFFLLHFQQKTHLTWAASRPQQDFRHREQQVHPKSLSTANKRVSHAVCSTAEPLPALSSSRLNLPTSGSCDFCGSTNSLQALTTPASIWSMKNKAGLSSAPCCSAFCFLRPPAAAEGLLPARQGLRMTFLNHDRCQKAAPVSSLT